MSSWDEGFRAGKGGLVYKDNPYPENDKRSDAWAFGCSEGMKERNRQAFKTIIKRTAK